MSQLARLRAAQSFVAGQREQETVDAFDVNTAYSDVVSYTNLDEEVFATMVGEDKFAEKHGIYFSHQKNLEKGAYDKLEDFAAPGVEAGRFKIIKDVDDAMGVMNSRATNVSFNDKTSGEVEIGKMAKNGILIDVNTGQIHALNETKNGIFPFTLFRDNDPESPVLFTTGEGLYQTLNEGLRDNIKKDRNIDLVVQARAEKNAIEEAYKEKPAYDEDGNVKVDEKGNPITTRISPAGTEEDQGAPIRFQEVLSNIDTDVENGTITAFEGLQAKSELWPEIQAAIDAAYEQDKQEKEDASKPPTDREMFGQVDKETVISQGNRSELEYGTVNTSQAKYGSTLDLANEIITAYESGNPLATTAMDIEALDVFRSGNAMENNRSYYKTFDTRLGAKSFINIPAINQRIAELEGQADDYTQTRVNPYGGGFTANPITLEVDTYTVDKASLLAEARSQKIIAEKAIYEYASYAKDMLYRDDEDLREAGYEKPRRNLQLEINRKNSLLANDNITQDLRDKTEKELEELTNKINRLDENNPVLSRQYVLPPNVDKVDEMPTFKLPTKEDGSYDDAAVMNYIKDNQDDLQALIGQETMDKVSSAFIKYNVTPENADFHKLPFYDPELNLSANEIALSVATMAARNGTGTTYADVYMRTFNAIMTGDPFISPKEKYELNRGTATYNIQFEQSAMAAIRTAQKNGDNRMVDVLNGYMEYINGDKRVDLLKNYKGENVDEFMDPLTADGGTARANFNGLMAQLEIDGSYYGTPIQLDGNGRLIHPDPQLRGTGSPVLNSSAQSATELITGDILLALAIRHGNREKGGFFGLFSGRDSIDKGVLSSIVNNTQVVVKAGPGGKPVINKLIFDDGTGVPYEVVLPNRALSSLVPDPRKRAIMMNVIPQGNIRGTSFNYLELE